MIERAIELLRLGWSIPEVARLLGVDWAEIKHLAPENVE